MSGVLKDQPKCAGGSLALEGAPRPRPRCVRSCRRTKRFFHNGGTASRPATGPQQRAASGQVGRNVRSGRHLAGSPLGLCLKGTAGEAMPVS